MHWGHRDRSFLGALGLGMALAGCGGEDLKASEHCRDLVDLLCDNAASECVPALDVETCEALAADAGLDCAHAIGLDDDYDTCFDTLSDTEGCIFDGELPAVCEGVIYLEGE